MGKQRKVVLMMETSRAYGRSILRGIARYSRLHGPWIFHRSPPFYWRTDRAETSLRALRKLGADGLIVREQASRAQTERILGLHLPAVVSPYTEPFAGPPNILTDDAAIGAMAAEHLLARGFRHFAYCGFGGMYFWSRERGRSFCQRIRDAGFESHYYENEQLRNEACRSWEKEQSVLMAWLRRLPTPVGLMTCNDDRSQYVLEACRSAGLHVPEQVAIMGVGNDDLICDLADPPLSSVALSTRKAGYEAAAALDGLMNGMPATDTIVVRPSRVVTRQSTDVFAVADRYVLEALRFIHTRARREALVVDDVLRAVSLSRRRLYDRFLATLGRSIHEEIKRVRTDEIMHLLVSTDLPMSEVAARVGYPDMKNLARYFKQETGLTPLQYRQRHSLL